MPDNLTMRWKAVDRKRSEFIVWARQKFRVALRRQLIQFQKATDDAVVVGDLSRGVNFITDQPIRDAFNQVYVKVGGSFAVQTTQQLKSTKGYLVKDFTVSDYRDFIESWVASYAGERIMGITKTSQELMTRVIQRAFDEGLGIDEAKRLINKQFPQYSIARSELIARTEIVSASNLGSISSARATGLNLKKTWLATRDNRTRDIHASADGQTVGINEMFNVGGERLEYPGDVFGSAANVCNCRCTVFFEEADEQAQTAESVFESPIPEPQVPSVQLDPLKIGVQARYLSQNLDDISEAFAKTGADFGKNKFAYGNAQNTLAEIQGFRGLPTVLDEADFAKLSASDDVIPVFRGLAGDTQAEVDGYINQFKYGELRHSTRNMYGEGQYFAGKNDFDVAVIFADDKPQNVIHGLFPKSARIFDYKDAMQKQTYDNERRAHEKRVLEKYEKKYGKNLFDGRLERDNPKAYQELQAEIMMTADFGAWATARGYDGYTVRVRSSLQGFEGRITDYVVVLNRTKLFVRK